MVLSLDYTRETTLNNQATKPHIGIYSEWEEPKVVIEDNKNEASIQREVRERIVTPIIKDRNTTVSLTQAIMVEDIYKHNVQIRPLEV